MSNNALAVESYLVNVGRGVTLYITPRRVGPDVFLRVNVHTPLFEGTDGDVNVVLQMKAFLFDAMMTLARKYNVVPRIADLLEGSFGQRMNVEKR